MSDKIRDDYRKFDELLNLIRELSRPINGLTYDDIMDVLHCSRKTAERVISFLANRYVNAFYEERDPIKTQIKRFRLEGADGLPPEYLQGKELLALNAAIKKIQDPTISESLKTLEYKLNRILQFRKPVKEMNDLEGEIISREVVSYPHPHILVEENILTLLQKAVLASVKVRAVYKNAKGEEKEYILFPLGFLYGVSNDYLVAYKDKPQGKVQQFILSEFKEVDLIKSEHFNVGKFDLKDYAKRSFGAYHSEKGPFEIVWRVSPEAATEAKRYLFHPSQKITTNKDGSLTIRFKADGLWELCWEIFKWKGDIVPVSPAALVETYKEFLDKCQKSLV